MKPELDDIMYPNRYQTDGSCLTTTETPFQPIAKVRPEPFPDSTGMLDTVLYTGNGTFDQHRLGDDKVVLDLNISHKPNSRQHNHYFKSVKKLEYIDVYRVIELFEITDPCIQHAVKKLLVAGGRGHKDIDKDIQDAIDSCLRWQEMRKEDKNV